MILEVQIQNLDPLGASERRHMRIEVFTFKKIQGA